MFFFFNFLNFNKKYIFLSITLLFLFYYPLLINSNFFNSKELDIYVLFDYLARSNLDGWRLDKIIGTNMHLGDPSFNSWSLLSLLYNSNIIDKIKLHNIIFLILSLYSSISLFSLINYANPKLKKLYASLISCLIFISILRLEFNYVFSWLLVYPTVILTCLTLSKYFKSFNERYIFQLFIIFFIGFNLGSIFALQQSLFFSFIFFIYYSFYYKKNILFAYTKIIFLSLIFLILTSAWIFYPYLLETIFFENFLTRTADYKKIKLLEINIVDLKFFFNLLFGAFLNTQNTALPDKDITPFFHWNNSLGVFFNFIFLYYLFNNTSKNFWITFSKYVILFYLIHITFSEVSPFYYSLNLFILDTMSWSKVNIELYIFQLLLLSFFISNKENIFNSPTIKIYFCIIFFYTLLVLLFCIDISSSFNFTKKLTSNIFSLIFYIFYDLNLTEEESLLFINDFYERIKFIISTEFILFQVTNFLLLLYLILNNKFNKFNYKLTFIFLIISNNYFSASYFTPLEVNNYYIWNNIVKEKVIQKDERIISLTNNYLLNLKNKKVNYKNLNKYEIQKWINNNPINLENKYYGIMSPPFLSFSSNASFIFKKLKEDNIKLLDEVSDELKIGYTSDKSFELLQEGIYNLNFINNLSIKYAYSLLELKNLELFDHNIKPYWNDGNIFIYEINNSLPYIYLPKKILNNKKKFYEYKILENEVYLGEKEYEKFRNLKLGDANYKAEIVDNSHFKISYKSKSENILVISNLFDKKWKHDSNQNLEIIRVNNYFTGIILKPGDYSFTLYFDNSKYYIGIYISIISIIFMLLYIFLNSKNNSLKSHN